MLLTMYLLRHPPVTAWAGRCYGQTDMPVDSVSLAAAVTQVEAGMRPLGGRFTIYSSPLTRCRALAERLHRGLPDVFGSPLMDERLKEMDFAGWEGLEWDGIARSEIDAWAADSWDYRPGGGESARQMLQRWRSFKAEMTRQFQTSRQSSDVANGAIGDDKDVAADAAAAQVPDTPLLVTHAGIIRLAMFDAGLLSEEHLWLHKVPYAHPIRVLVEPIR